MKQKTIGKKVELVGIGLHKGVPVKMILEPLSDNSGIVFYQSKLNQYIELKPENVIDTTMATVLGKGEARISTIEHILSAIHAHGIDNLKISLDNEEVPIMDGSASAYCLLLQEACIVEQNKPKRIIKITKPIEVRENEKFVRIEPSKEMIFDFKIKFPHNTINEQHYRFVFSTQKYIDEISNARTFGFLHEVNKLREMGLAKGGSFNNCIVLDEKGVLNKEGLRYKDEFVRHKILDAIGDLALLGMPLFGSYVAFAGSHKLNHLVTSKILDNEQHCYEYVEVEEDTIELERAYALN